MKQNPFEFAARPEIAAYLQELSNTSCDEFLCPQFPDSRQLSGDEQQLIHGFRALILRVVKMDREACQKEGEWADDENFELAASLRTAKAEIDDLSTQLEQERMVSLYYRNALSRMQVLLSKQSTPQHMTVTFMRRHWKAALLCAICALVGLLFLAF